jgi:RecA/RadA recombinase
MFKKIGDSKQEEIKINEKVSDFQMESIENNIDDINQPENVEVFQDGVEYNNIDDDNEYFDADESVIEELSEEVSSELQDSFDKFIGSKVETESLDDFKVLSTGIDILDGILGGGIPLGNFCVFVGNPGGGKSTLAVKPIQTMQEKYKDKCLTIYLDSEETMSSHRLAELGVVSPRIKPKGNITIEKVFEIIEGIILFKTEKNIIDYPTLVVWDSIANTITNKDLTAKDVNETIGLKARILSTTLPRYITKLRKYNITILAINQLREKIQMGLFQSAPDLKYMGNERDMPGGQAIKFNAAQLLNMRHKSDIKKDQFGFDGAKIHVRTVKNKLFIPNLECDIVLDFKRGFDNFWTNYIFLSENKYIKTGAWNKLPNYDKKSFRTYEAKMLYQTDPEFKKCFDELVTEAINQEIKKMTE